MFLNTGYAVPAKPPERVKGRPYSLHCNGSAPVRSLPALGPRRPDHLNGDPATTSRFHGISRTALTIGRTAVPNSEQAVDVAQNGCTGVFVRSTARNTMRHVSDGGGTHEQPVELIPVVGFDFVLPVVHRGQHYFQYSPGIENDFGEELIGPSSQARDSDELVIRVGLQGFAQRFAHQGNTEADRKSTRLNSSHVAISYAVFC